MAKWKYDNRKAYEQRLAAMLREERGRLEQEALLFAGGDEFGPLIEKKSRYTCFNAVMTREAASLGFHFDRQSSTAAFPCFSKPLTADWQLSWGIEDPGMFHIAPTYGDYDPFLVLRNKRLKGAAYGARLGEFVRIRYQHIVPGFSNAYWKFFSLAALAHLFLYGLMAPLIEDGIKQVLGPGRD